jgi:hypothetical protein
VAEVEELFALLDTRRRGTGKVEDGSFQTDRKRVEVLYGRVAGGSHHTSRRTRAMCLALNLTNKW